MRLVFYTILILIPFNQYAQSELAKNKILMVKEKLESVPPYECDIKINIDVSFINIKERSGKMTFLNPNDIDYKIIRNQQVCSIYNVEPRKKEIILNSLTLKGLIN